MIIAAAREIQNGEVVFVGMRLPIMAYAVARLTHAPDAVGFFECGVMRHHPARSLLYTMGDPANQKAAAWLTGTLQLMGLLQAGKVDAGFIGGAQIDRFGNINTSRIGEPGPGYTKLPGSGGAADIAAKAKKLFSIMKHQRRRFVERVDYITSTGYLDGGNSRQRAGLSRGGTTAVITDLGILRPFGPNHELHLASWHPGVTVAQIQEATGWNLLSMPDAEETAAPSKQELLALKAVDPEGFWS